MTRDVQWFNVLPNENRGPYGQMLDGITNEVKAAVASEVGRLQERVQNDSMNWTKECCDADMARDSWLLHPLCLYGYTRWMFGLHQNG